MLAAVAAIHLGGIVAVAAEQQGGGQRTVDFVERDRVVAGLAEDLDVSGIGDRGWAALDGDGSPVHENLPSSIAGGHDRVIEGVTELGQHLSAGRKRRCDGHDLILTMRFEAGLQPLTGSSGCIGA